MRERQDMITRKDYQAIAKMLAVVGAESQENRTATDQVAEKLADYFAVTNPRFDRERFTSAYQVGWAILRAVKRVEESRPVTV